MRPEGAEAHDDEIRAVTHQFDWDEDAPINTIRGGSIQIQFYSGQVMEIEIAACAGRAFLSGGGYVTAHGKWRGESFAEHDVYDLTEVSRLRDYNSATSDHLIEARWQGQTGFGIIEYLKRRGYGDARGAAGD